jgi:DNA polymerase-4
MRKIIHIDMDYFFAQVEERDNPSLKDKPVGIGSDKSRRGVLSTCNYIAREYGVRSAMPTFKAKELCPHIVMVKPHFQKYREASDIVFNIFREYTDKIQGISLDEAYLDVTDCEKFSNSATLIAQDIKKRIYQETKLTASAGVSYNKLIAKIASDYNKPNGLTLVTPDQSMDFIQDLSLKEINGVGAKTFERCKKLGLETFNDVRKLSKVELENYFGNFAETLYNYVRGIDHREVKSHGIRKSVSCERTFSEDIEDKDTLLLYIDDLYDELKHRLRKYDDREVRGYFMKIKYADFSVTTIEKKFSDFSLDHYYELFITRWNERSEAIRLLGAGVRFGDGETQQLDLGLSS